MDFTEPFPLHATVAVCEPEVGLITWKIMVRIVAFVTESVPGINVPATPPRLAVMLVALFELMLIIVFVADHGTMMGEQGQLHKGETRIRTQVTHVPLMIYHPRQKWGGRRVKGFVQHPDLMPTVLDLVGVPPPARVTGESLRPLVESGAASGRETIITGWGEHGAVRNHEWVYIGRWSPGPVFEQLYDVRRDPKELTDVAGKNPAVVAEFRARLKDHVNSGWTITRGTFATRLA